MSNIKLLYKQCISGIKNCVRWFPIIWNDRQWDYYYLFVVLQTKLTLMEDEFSSDRVICKNSSTLFAIRECRILVDRLIKDDYHNNAFMHHNKQYGNIKLEFNDGRVIIDRPNVLPEEKEKERKISKQLFKKEDYMRNQDKDRLFYLLSKYIFTFWD